MWFCNFCSFFIIMEQCGHCQKPFSSGTGTFCKLQENKMWEFGIKSFIPFFQYRFSNFKEWTFFTCLLRLLFWLKQFPHWLQEYGLSPVWVKIWTLTWPGLHKTLEHCGQVLLLTFCNFEEKEDQFYFISKLCTVFKCLRRLLFRLKALTHKLHPKGCSPVWLKMCCLTRDGALISLEQNGQAHRCSPSWIGSFCNFNQ